MNGQPYGWQPQQPPPCWQQPAHQGPPGYPPPVRRSRTGLIVGAVGAALVLVIAAVVVAAALSNRADAVDPPYKAMSQAFPRLLPVEDGGKGYNGAPCTRLDPKKSERARSGENDFGRWIGGWECEGDGFATPDYLIYAYRSAKAVRSVVDGLTPKKEFTEINGGVQYTSYELYGCCYAGPKIATTFPDDANRSTYLMYSRGSTSMRSLIEWWKSAPLS
ncbi:hypothetical protein [Nocardia sp. NPDC050710]|uniref:hypothetical protein n=1 Tax=Nocardia sp. NPDC050710 TaxID=3157220 RepID=UPI0033F93DDE